MSQPEPARPIDITEARLKLAATNGRFGPTLQKLLGGPALENAPANVISVWRSETHIVSLRKFDHRHVLFIQRAALDENFQLEVDPMTWTELQRIKAEAGFGDCFAMEIYPPNKHLVRGMDCRCLWIADDELDFGWRIVTPDTERAKANGHSLDFPVVRADDNGMPPNVAQSLMDRMRFMP